MVKANNAMGFVTSEMGKPKVSVSYLETALDLARRQKYNDQIIFLLNNLGSAYKKLGNYAKSLQYYLESLELRKAGGSDSDISVAMNNLGALHQDMGDYENALLYYTQNYQLIASEKDKYNFELALVNLSDILFALNRFDEAQGYLLEAFDFCNKQGNCNIEQLGHIRLSLGRIYTNKGEFIKAKEQLNEAILIFTNLKSAEQTNALNALALAHFKSGDSKGALELLNKAQSLAEGTDVPKYLMRNYQLFADIYHQQKDFRRASEYQRKFIELSNKIYNADLTKNIARIQSEHNEGENLRTIAAQENEILDKGEQLAKQQKQLIFIVAVTLLVGIGTFLIYRGRVKVAQVNTKLANVNMLLVDAKKLIEEQNARLQEQNISLDNQIKERTVALQKAYDTLQKKNDELFASNKSLQTVNDELDNFIYKTSHDIRGPLSTLKGLITLAIKQNKDEETKTYLNLLTTTSDKLDGVLTRLQIINQINNTLLVAEPINFAEITDSIITFCKKRQLPANFQFFLNIEEIRKLLSDKNIIFIILQNLIDNAIKFSDGSQRKEPFVSIKIQSTEVGATIKIIDNGIGFKNVPPEQMFRMFVRASEQSQTGGIGLYMAKLAAEKIGGTIQLRINEEKNTEFIVSLPPNLSQVLQSQESARLQHDYAKMEAARKQLESLQKS